MRPDVVALILTIGFVSSSDPGHDGYIVDCYLENVKTLIRRNHIDSFKLPDFTSTHVSLTDGYLEHLDLIDRVDMATLTKYENGVTNLVASFYIPDAPVHYKLSFFGLLEGELNVRVMINELVVNVNYTQGRTCSIEYDENSFYISLLEGSTVSVTAEDLHSKFIPSAVVDFVETSLESTFQVYLNTGLNYIVRNSVSKSLMDSLKTQIIGNVDLCDIFDGPENCGTLTN